jgi:hypothetical protein
MKNKLGFFGLLLIAAGGMIMAGLTGCEHGPATNNGTGEVSVTVTGVTGQSGMCGIWLVPDLTDNANAVAIGGKVIQNGALAITLKRAVNNGVSGDSPMWLGSGDYYVAFVPATDNWQFANRKIYCGSGSDPVKVAFDGTAKSLEYQFSQFKNPSS